MKIVYSRRADKSLDGIAADRRRQLLGRIAQLADDPLRRGLDVKAMAGIGGLYRMRVGDYRVIFALDRGADTITIELIRTRGDVYKR